MGPLTSAMVTLFAMATGPIKRTTLTVFFFVSVVSAPTGEFHGRRTYYVFVGLMNVPYVFRSAHLGVCVHSDSGGGSSLKRPAIYKYNLSLVISLELSI